MVKRKTDVKFSMHRRVNQSDCCVRDGFRGLPNCLTTGELCFFRLLILPTKDLCRKFGFRLKRQIDNNAFAAWVRTSRKRDA